MRFGMAEPATAPPPGPFICPALRRLPLGRAVLPERATGEPFREAELLPDMLDASTAAGGAQRFPDAASRSMSFPNVSSETAFRSRSFSLTSSFSRFTWSVFNPPHPLRHRSSVNCVTEIDRSGFGHRLTLRYQNTDLPEPGDDLLRLVLLPGYSFILQMAQKPSLSADHFSGGRPAPPGPATDRWLTIAPIR